MADNKHPVAMFAQNENGERVQVGWASPRDESGVRTLDYLAGYGIKSTDDISFEDDELTQLVAEEQAAAREDENTDGEEFEIEVSNETPESTEPVDASPDAELAAEPVYETSPEEETVELDSGGAIVETPTTRRELRENGDDS